MFYLTILIQQTDELLIFSELCKTLIEKAQHSGHMISFREFIYAHQLYCQSSVWKVMEPIHITDMMFPHQNVNIYFYTKTTNVLA